MGAILVMGGGGVILCGGFNNPLWTMFLEKQLPVLQVKSQLLPHNKNENSFLNKTNKKNSKKGNNIFQPQEMLLQHSVKDESSSWVGTDLRKTNFPTTY